MVKRLMRQPHDSIENTVMTGLVDSRGLPVYKSRSAKNMLVLQYHNMDWLVGMLHAQATETVLKFC